MRWTWSRPARRARRRPRVRSSAGTTKGGRRPPGCGSGFARNVTAYPDITELYLLSDVLVTDYSSAMFDFAITGRPILFFTYDLEADTATSLRGFYFDFEARPRSAAAPTSAEVIDAIPDVDAVAAAHHDAYQRFAARFCSLDDGRQASVLLTACSEPDRLAGRAEPRLREH